MAEYIIKGDPGAEGHDGRALAATEIKVAEYIDKTDLLERLKNAMQSEYPANKLMINYAHSVVLHAPAADVVEVVRCRDCIYREFDNGCPLKESGYFKNGKMLPLDNDFCSYGERKQ